MSRTLLAILARCEVNPTNREDYEYLFWCYVHEREAVREVLLEAQKNLDALRDAATAESFAYPNEHLRSFTHMGMPRSIAEEYLSQHNTGHSTRAILGPDAYIAAEWSERVLERHAEWDRAYDDFVKLKRMLFTHTWGRDIAEILK